MPTLTVCEKCGKYVSDLERDSVSGHKCGKEQNRHADVIKIHPGQYFMIVDNTCSKVIFVRSHTKEAALAWAEKNIPDCDYDVMPYYWLKEM